MLQVPAQPESAIPHAGHVEHRPLMIDWQDNVLRQIGRAEPVDFQQLAQLPTTDE